MKTTIVTTTINIPVLLKNYAENAAFHGHKDLDFIVIGDRKSPPETADFCSSIDRFYPCRYLDIAAQKSYLTRFPALDAHLRYDSIQRRNVGLLLAYELGADVLITIDDDNFVMNEDFVGLHGIVGSTARVPVYGSTTGWLNVCSALEVDNDVRFYHRGYPQKQRWNEHAAFVSRHECERKVVVNAGFWLDNPDIDALTRMERQPVVRGFKSGADRRFALHPGTWSPFNSQNTALAREVIPSYFLSPYIGRYDDIWASYIVMRIAEHLGHLVTFGEPLVRQERNPHDLWRDLDVERNGMIMTDAFCEALRDIPLSARTYAGCFAQVLEGLRSRWTEGAKWTESQKEWRSRLLEGMEIWHDCHSRFRGSQHDADGSPLSSLHALSASLENNGVQDGVAADHV